MPTALLEAPIRYQVDESIPIEELDIPEGYEFVDGNLEEMNVSYLSTYVAKNIIFILESHVKPGRLGWVSSEGASYKCFPDDADKYRRPDVAFHVRGRLTRAEATTSGPVSIVPDLVVEVISPNDLSYKVDRKRKEWLSAGAKLVWIVNPETQEIMVYRPDVAAKQFFSNDILTADPVLPDFRVPMAEVFEMPEDPV